MKNWKNHHFSPKILVLAHFEPHAHQVKKFFAEIWQVGPVSYILKSLTWEKEENRRKISGPYKKYIFFPQQPGCVTKLNKLENYLKLL